MLDQQVRHARCITRDDANDVANVQSIEAREGEPSPVGGVDLKPSKGIARILNDADELVC